MVLSSRAPGSERRLVSRSVWTVSGQYHSMSRASRKEFWDGVYTLKPETSLSWFQDEPGLSLELIEAVLEANGGRIVDVGGGASTLVDRLLDRPSRKVTVLDISEAALDKSRSRLRDRACRVEWIAGDVTTIATVGSHDVWHDRAVFHFLTEEADRRRYVELASRTVPAAGHLVIATFADDGPSKCSGLDVCRYDARSLAGQFAADFSLVHEARETHMTPGGRPQPFFYGVFRPRVE